ncbi:hypothetical protein FACS1894168_2190 [Deltaproteobacteria bacterium]|nr:hypothetical protein FACS1894168_2190 [Deltaproteobacteria bacterium]
MNFPKLDTVIQGHAAIQLPRMVKVRQKFATTTVEDPAAALKKLLPANVPQTTITGLLGKSIAISASSRGIPCHKELLRVIVAQLKEWGAFPFVFPAMGSHAGGTAESQKQFLEEYGITEEYVGAPIKSSMEVVEVARLDDGLIVYCDKYAAEADGIVVFNKIKPHTHLKAKHESGLLKMICIGIGKHKGAATFHSKSFDEFEKYLVLVSQAFIKAKNVVFGVGVTQNAYDLIGKIDVFPPQEIIAGDAEMLALAKEQMARLKFDAIDVLIIDEIGKDISGVGFDTNVSGRIEVLSQQAAFRAIAPDIKKIVLLDITEHSHGNASGMGEADLLSYRFVNKIDFGSTYTNIITNKYLKAAAMPIYGNSDLDVIKTAVLTSIHANWDDPKIVRIKNTLMLEEIEVSSAYLEEIRGRDDIAILSEPCQWKFNSEGNLW